MITVTFLPDNTTQTVEQGTTIMQAAIAAGLKMDAPCGGRGLCKKCRVTLKTSQTEQEVLACQTALTEDSTVILDHEAVGHRILLGGITRNISLNPAVDGKYAVAFDIGTTTVASYLLDLKTGAELATASLLNPQTKYGGDVIMRIKYSLENGVDALTHDIQNALASLVSECSLKAHIDSTEVALITIVGNTTMHHLFLGITTETLAFAPYNAKVTEPLTLKASDYGFAHVCPDATLLMFPNVAGFVGADTVGAALAAALDETDEMTLLIDIGTNGEMVLGNKHHLATTSTAAGPAFEGALISCGMRGAEGAIDHVEIETSGDNNNQISVKYSVIGDVKPIGICGSGLIDAISELVRTGLVDDSGRLTCGSEFRIADGVSITAKDVRELQLAKGAMAAGVQMLRERVGVAEQDISRVMIAGAFGSYMKPESACGINLIPKSLLNRVVAIGNAAGQGAKLAALSKDEYERAKHLAVNMDYMDLATLPEFNDIFVDNLTFE